MVVTLVQPLHMYMTWSNNVVVHIECEEEREAVFHMPPTTTAANNMTFVLYTSDNIKIK